MQEHSGLCSIGPRDGRILSTAGKRFPGRLICEGETHGFETTCSKGIPQKRRRVGRWFHLGSRSTRDRPGTSDTTHPPPMIKGDKDQIAYGDRSRFVTSVRIAHGGRPSPDNFGLDVSCGDAASGFGRGDHAILAPLRGDDPWLLHPGHRSPGASSHDPRHGGPSADLHHGGLEAPPFRHPPSFHRVRGESIVAQGEDRSGNARDDQLRRMDRRAPL